MATLALSQGVNPKLVQDRLGHSRIDTTLDVYTHVQPSMQREAADLVDRALGQIDSNADSNGGGKRWTRVDGGAS